MSRQEGPNETELSRLLANVLTETPTASRSNDGREERSAIGIDQTPSDGGENQGWSYNARINRLSTAETGESLGDLDMQGTSNRQRSSLFIDTANSGMESTEGGLAMLSARSTGNSTIDSIMDVTPLRYEIYQFPKSLAEVEALCRQHQSGGITACIRTGCRLNHKGPKIGFEIGCVVVGRSTQSVFLDPIVHPSRMTEEVLAHWKRTPQTLQNWNELFRLVNSNDELEVSTMKVLKDQQQFNDYAKEWQSPGKRVSKRFPVPGNDTRSRLVALIEEETAILTRAFGEPAKGKDETEAEAGSASEPTPLLFSGEWGYAEAFRRLDLESRINKNIIRILGDALEERTDLVSEEMKILLSRIQGTESTVGIKVAPSDPKFDAPSIWGSISTLVAAFEEAQSDLLEFRANGVKESVMLEKRLVDGFEQQLQEVLTTASTVLSDQMDTAFDSIKDQTAVLKSTQDSMLLLARGSNKLKEEIGEIRSSLDLVKNSVGGHTEKTDDSTMVSEISSIKVMMRSIGNRIDSVVEGRESKAIKFFGVTFRSNVDAENWVGENLDNDSYGLIVDAHMVLEHVYHQAFSDDGSLKELNGLYKIKIDNITQGLAMSSFDHPMPKFFSVQVNSTSKKPKIKKADASHFDNIDNWEDWDLPLMGFRAKLKDQLEEFEETHLRMISETLSSDDVGYRVSTMSVQASVGWVKNFVAYIDETYTETSRLQSFTSARAWQLVSQIGRRILTDVASPRNGVKKLFRVGDNTKIAQTMFWPIIQSHEIMNRYKKANFKDDPAVSNEFMKFMATNSGSTDGLSTIKLSVVKLESDVRDSVRACKGASTSATLSANKADEVKRLLTALIQRVTILEKAAK